MGKLTRRDFLRIIAASCVGLTTGQVFAHTTYDNQSALPSQIPIPPSLMLHSRHRWILPDILDYLLDNGYTGIHYADFENALLGLSALPEKPILISIDDITAVKGQNPTIIEYFSAMKKSLTDRNFKGSFALITRPDLEQDDDLWTEIRSWTREGIAIETHTSFHSYLDRRGMRWSEYEVEIIHSAQFITEKIGIPVRALVTPYGSGYDMQRQRVTPQITQACEQAGLRFIVGIVAGRTPIQLPITPTQVLYVGRVGPWSNNPIEGTLSEIEFWRTHYR